MSGSGIRPVAPLPANNAMKTQYVEDFYVYEMDFAAAVLVPGAVVNGNIQVQADSDFKLIKLAYFADIAAAAQVEGTRVIPLCTVQIVDSGSGRQLFQNPAPIPSIFGTGQLPFIMPIPRIFKARSNIAFTVANFDAAVAYNLRLSLIGTKIFQLGPA